MKLDYCEDCHRANRPISSSREECLDMCDECYNALQERVKFMSDRDNRMAVTRAATFLASNSNSKQLRMRAFFASVMPEYPQHKVDDFVNKIKD